MTREEVKSCIGTIEMLQRLAYNIHGVMDVVDADNCKNIIKALEKEPCEDCISRQEAINCATLNEFRYKIVEDIKTLPSVTPKEKTGRWISFGIQGEIDGQIVRAFTCSKCGAISIFRVSNGNIVNGDLCPNCGAKMQEVENDTN